MAIKAELKMKMSKYFGSLLIVSKFIFALKVISYELYHYANVALQIL